MARILLSAYACEPGRGSEPAVGWSWATELARLGHQITVVTRSANRAAIEHGACNSENLCFCYYDLPAWIQRCRRIPGGKTLYYILWQWFAVRRIRRVFPALPFDIVQHVTYVSARFPSFMGSLGIPFCFGPVSGGECVPRSLRARFSFTERWRERLRDLSNLLVPFDPLMRRTFEQAGRIVITRDTLRLVPPRWRHKAQIQLAVGLQRHGAAGNFRTAARHHRELSLLYVGRLLDWKGVDIALRAVSRLKSVRPDIRFTIVGQGPGRERLIKLSNKLGLQKTVRWVSWMPQPALARYYRAADLLLFPSLRDSGGMVVLEAMAEGLPVLCTDLGGPGLIVNATCGRAIRTAGRTPQQLGDAFANAVQEIMVVPHILESLSYGARARAHEFNFSNLVQALYPSAEARMVRQA